MTAVTAAPIDHARTPGNARGTVGRMTMLLDGLTDCFVWVFAAWTVVYHLGLPLNPSTSALVIAWVLAAATAVPAWVWLRRRRTVPGKAAEQTAEPPSHRHVDVPAWVGPALGIVAGLAAGLHSTGAPWWLGWTAALGAVAMLVATLLGRRLRWPSTSEQWGSVVALLSAFGCAVASLFIINTDGDDAFFVSRSVWVAENGRIPHDDVIFTQGTVGQMAGETPLASVEVLVGALARMLGVPAASLLWYVFLPSVVFLAVWAMWQLVREWAPRRVAACFVTAMVYLLWTGASAASFGAFHLLRMWHGKAVMVSLVVPLLYVYLTRWAEQRSRRALAMAALAGIAATGLSSSAVLVVPLVTAAVVGPLFLTRQFRTGLLGCAAMAYPVAGGLVTILLDFSTKVDQKYTPSTTSYQWVLLTGVMGVITGCAVWTAPWLARRGTPALITTGIAAITAFLCIPWGLDLIRLVTDAGPIMWRTMWVVPGPVLVGLIAALPVPDRLRRFAALPTLALCTTIMISGTPLWAPPLSQVADKPSWKALPTRLETTRAVLAANRGGGVVLMPRAYMRYVPVITTSVNAVNPNDAYLLLLPTPGQFIEDRQLLSDLADRKGPRPDPARVSAALRRVGVTIACIPPGRPRPRNLLLQAGFGKGTSIGELRCLFPASS